MWGSLFQKFLNMWYHFLHFKKESWSRRIVSSLLMLILVSMSVSPLSLSAEEDAGVVLQNEPRGNVVEPLSPPSFETPDVSPPKVPLPPESSSSDETTTVVTGDAVGDSNITNMTNTNLIDTKVPEEDAMTTVAAPPPEEALGEEGLISPATTTPLALSLSVDNQNSATSTTNATTTAESGDNEVNNNSGGGGSLVITGDALASSNTLNVINTNVVNSNGFFLLLNNLFSGFGNLDLRFFTEGTNTNFSFCGTLCNGMATSLVSSISNDNVAVITNNIVVRSHTGGNEANENAGGVQIGTGDAYAAANVVNVANTNIINSNYLLLTFNNFGSWGNDFILPNDNFFSRFFGGIGEALSSTSTQPSRGGALEVLNVNEAAVSNDVGTLALTGGNSADGNGGPSSIFTGNAFSGTSISNTINQNLFGGASVRLLFRIYGDWVGDVFNPPEGITWRQTPYGIELLGEGGESGGDAEPAIDLGSEASTTPLGGFNSSVVSNRNSASINNNVSVVALTGENRVSGNSATSTISTGNAYASANVVNIANSNIIGRNWIYAIINIFGSWTGNISFGQPDLWIGGSVEGSGAAGSSLSYKFTIANRGDAAASNVRIKSVADRRGLVDFSKIDSSDDAAVYWNVGSIPAGGAVEVVYSASVRGDIPEGSSMVTNTVTVTSRETDANREDNTDILSLRVYRNTPRQFERGYRVGYTPMPKLTVSKMNNAPFGVTASSSVNYKIMIDNGGGDAYHAVLIDTLKDSNGKVVNRQTWDLDTIYENESIEVDYTTVFKTETPPGEYTNYAEVRSIGGNPSLNPFYGWFANSNIATSSVTIRVSDPAPKVADVATSSEVLKALSPPTVFVPAPQPIPARKKIYEFNHPMLISLPQCFARLDTEPIGEQIKPPNENRLGQFRTRDLFKDLFGGIFHFLGAMYLDQPIGIETFRLISLR